MLNKTASTKFLKLLFTFLGIAFCNATEMYRDSSGLPNADGRKAMASAISDLERTKGVTLGLDIASIGQSHYAPSRFPFPLSCLVEQPADIRAFMESYGFQLSATNDGVTTGWLGHAERYMAENLASRPQNLTIYVQVLERREHFIGQLRNASQYAEALRQYREDQKHWDRSYVTKELGQKGMPITEEYISKRVEERQGWLMAPTIACSDSFLGILNRADMTPEKLARIRQYAQMWDDVLRCEGAERTEGTQLFLAEQRTITSGILDGFNVLEMLHRNQRTDPRPWWKRLLCCSCENLQ